MLFMYNFSGVIVRKRPLEDVKKSQKEFFHEKNLIKVEFLDLKDATIEFLRNKEIDVKKLKNCVLPLCRTVYKNLDERKKNEEIQKCESIDDVFISLVGCYSFLDYGILEKIIKYFGPICDRSDDVIINDPANVAINEKLDQYKKSVFEFLNNWQVKSHKFRLLDDREGQEIVRIKLDAEEMSQYQYVESAICQILKKPIHFLTLLSVEDGCIKLDFRCFDIAIFDALRLPESQRQHNQLKEIVPRIFRMTTVDNTGSECIVFEVIDSIVIPICSAN